MSRQKRLRHEAGRRNMGMDGGAIVETDPLAGTILRRIAALGQQGQVLARKSRLGIRGTVISLHTFKQDDILAGDAPRLEIVVPAYQPKIIRRRGAVLPGGAHQAISAET